MEPHVVDLPRKIILGRDVIEKLNPVCRELGLSGRALVLSDTVTRRVAGDRVNETLDSGIDSEICEVSSADYSEIAKLEADYSGVDFVVSVGGGRVIDIGKLFAFEKSVPFISVPTAPSHDGITSERVSITKDDKRHSVKGRPPIAIIADIGVLMKAPRRLIASGCADVISNYTAVRDWELGKEKGEYFSEYAARLSLMSAEIVIASADSISRLEERGIRNLMEALVTSGIAMSLVHSSRPASGSEHMFSHALDEIRSGGLHGEQCGLGAILMACHQGNDWERIKESLSVIGAPTTAKELGAEEEAIIKALLEAKNIRNRYTILDPKPLDAEKARELCIKTGVFG